MPITFSDAKTEVARSVGSQADAAQLLVAGTAIMSALREWNARHDWEFKLRTLADITLTPGQADYDLVADSDAVNPKRIHTANLEGNPRNLFFIRQREWDRVVRDQSTNDIPIAYTLAEDAAGVVVIRLFPSPTGGGPLIVRCYENITIPAQPAGDGTNLNIPDRLIPGIISLGSYYYLINRDAQNPRLGEFKQRAETLLVRAIFDDTHNPDEEIRFVPKEEWIGAQGSDIFDSIFFDGF